MAECTVNSRFPRCVKGNQVEQYYNLTITTGQTLTTPLKKILGVLMDPASITAVSYSGGVITFTGSATGVNVIVTGH